MRGKKAFSIDVSEGGLDGGFLFGAPTTTPNPTRRNFFTDNKDGGNEEEDDVIPGFIKRPASTGGIERSYNNDSDRDVSSILETLGLTSLDSTEDIGVPSNDGRRGSSGSGPSTPKKFFGDDSMIRHKGENVSSSSKASKYFTRDLSNDEDAVEASHNQFGVYENNGYGADNNVSSTFQAGGPTMQQQQQQTQQQPSLYSQFGQQHQQQQHPGPYESHQQQWGVHDSHQQMYYSHQPSQFVSQQPPPQLQNVMPGPQPTLYQINSPTQNPHQPFGYDYQQQQQNQQQPHILLQQGGGAPMYPPHQQPQFISIVPIQTAHHPIMNGHSGYAYVQYGPDGSMQLHHPQPTAMPNGPTTFIMGPHGQPIALSVPMNATGMGFPTSLSTSPPDGVMGVVSNLGSPRTPSRGGIKSDRGPRTPSTPNGMDARGKLRGNSLSSPRGGGKRGDKNVVVPSRMGPVAVGLLNDIRAAKSRNQWTVHDIAGKWPFCDLISLCVCHLIMLDLMLLKRSRC
jgi:hypothetical protein